MQVVVFYRELRAVSPVFEGCGLDHSFAGPADDFGLFSVYVDDGNGRDSQVVWQGTAKNDQVPQFGTVILEAKSAK